MNIIKRWVHWISLKIQAMLNHREYHILSKNRITFFTKLLAALKSNDTHEIGDLQGYFDGAILDTDNSIKFSVGDYRFTMQGIIHTSDRADNTRMTIRTYEDVKDLSRLKNEEKMMIHVKQMDISMNKNMNVYFAGGKPVFIDRLYQENFLKTFAANLIAYIDGVENKRKPFSVSVG